MDLIANADADAMRAAPQLAHQRDDFSFYIYPNFEIPCRLYHTPGIAPEAPDAPGPVAPQELPPRGRGRRSRARLEQEQQYADDLASYNAAKYAPIVPNAAPKDEIDGPPVRPDPTCIFTHGRGSTLDNPAVVAFSQGFARSSAILNFHDTRPMDDRVTTFRALMQHYPTANAIGGRSMGARASCRASLYSSVRKLIFFTYPLIRGLDERFDELLSLPANVDVLMIIGDEDALAPEVILKAVRERMRARTWWVRVVKADHAVWYADEAVRDTICNVCGQIAARWNADDNRDPALTELTIRYNGAEDVNQVEWTNWMAPQADPVRAPTQFHVGLMGGGFPLGGGFVDFSI